MLGRDRDYPVTAGWSLLDAPLESPVDRLGRAARESDAAALEAGRTLHLLARDLDRRFGLIAPARRRMLVRELLLDPRLHRPCDFRRNRSRRLVVEVNHA